MQIQCNYYKESVLLYQINKTLLNRYVYDIRLLSSERNLVFKSIIIIILLLKIIDIR